MTDKEMLSKIKELAISRLDNCEDFLIQLNRLKGTAYKEVEQLEVKELPEHINDSPAYKNRLVKTKLVGEPLTKDPMNLLEPLWDTEFDYDDYKNIGHNDGTLATLWKLFRILDMKEEEERANALIYSD
jgi:hypothetical protein